MVFSSHIFMFYFLPIFLAIYFLLVFSKVQLGWLNLFITLTSYVFYGWFEPWFVILMWISSIVDFASGRAISDPDSVNPQKVSLRKVAGELGRLNIFYPVFLAFGWFYHSVIDSDKKRIKLIRNTALVVSMVSNLGLLAYFKYYMFVMGGVNKLAMLLGGDGPLFDVLPVMLPIGISFYTFQTMSYTIDVWRGDAPPVKDMRTFSCFVALFPQLIAGPIVRYNTVAEQLATRTHTLSMFTSGLTVFMLGFAKKILLANPAGSVADAVFAADAADATTAWWGILGYHFQIYFDFCAYSDMAVGLGRMMGFEFIKNFNAPYRAVSISDFWNRWHISLSTFIRDYVYIALGGNRLGAGRTYFNLALAMFLCGLWHGAKMTFIIWGVFQAVLLIWERTMGRQAIYRALPTIPKVLITNAIVMLTWVVFRAASLDEAMHYWSSMFGMVPTNAASLMLRAELFNTRHVVEMIICAIFVWQPLQAHEWVEKMTVTKAVLTTAVFALAIVAMFGQSFNPFLYFQF